MPVLLCICLCARSHAEAKVDAHLFRTTTDKPEERDAPIPNKTVAGKKNKEHDQRTRCGWEALDAATQWSCK
eukprot:6188346-Pleurochrysis_carterae.AAC.3